MKIHIPMMQSGGGLPPFVSYTPLQLNTAQAATLETSSKAKDDDDTKGKITDKDLLTMLKDIDGLPSDMLALYKNLQTFYEMGGSDDPLNTSSLSTKYIQALQLIKTAKYRKEVFDKAYDLLKANGGLHEYAITDTGRLVGMNDKGELKTFTLEEAKGNDSYQILTNAQLMQYRAENAAGQDSLSAIAANGIGMELVNKLIKDNLMSLGENSSTREGYLSGKTQEGLLLLSLLMQENKLTQGTDLLGLYKAKIVTKEQMSKIKGVLDYAYQMLPQNAKTLLAVKNGGSQESYNLIYNALVGTTKESSEIDLDYIEDAEGHKPGSKTKDSTIKDLLESNTAMLFVQGLGEQEGFTIMNGTSNGIRLLSNVMPVVSKSGDPLGNGATLAQVSSSQMGPVLDLLNAYMGDLKLSEASMMKVMTDGQVHSMDLPLDIEAFSKGDSKPDLDSLKRMEKADDEIKQSGISSKDYNKINEIYTKYNLPVKYNQDGSLKTELWGRFAVFNATALGQALGPNVSMSNLLEEVNDDDEELNLLDMLRKQNDWKTDKEFKYDKRSWWDNMLGNPHNLFSENDAFYKGTAFVLMRTNPFNALAGSGEKIKTGTPNNVNHLEGLQQLKQRLSTYVNPGSFSTE